jgi:hypothetical protein
MHTFLIPIIAFLQRSPGPQAVAITASVQIDLGLTTTRHVFRQLNSLQKHFILLATWAISNYQAVVVAPVNANRQMSSSPINHSGTMTACLPGSILIVKPYNECWPKRILARARRLPIRPRTGLNRFLPGNYTADRAACAPEILAGAGRQVKVNLDFIDVCFVSRHFLTIGEVELVRVGRRFVANKHEVAVFVADGPLGKKTVGVALHVGITQVTGSVPGQGMTRKKGGCSEQALHRE